MTVDHKHLIEMDLEEAMRSKGMAGEAQYGTDPSGRDGKPIFVGDPLFELHGETIDALNYCDFSVILGYSERRINVIRELLQQARALAVQEYERNGGFRFPLDKPHYGGASRCEVA